MRQPTASTTSGPNGALDADSRRLRLVHREIVLLLLLAGVAVAAFLLTRVVAAGNERMRRQDAAVWYDVGQAGVASRPDEALTALRRAVSKDPGNKRYQVALAGALASSHQDEAARQVLVGLRDVTPEDADVNIELARLEARRGDLSEARRYYQTALNAVWDVEQSDRRRALRLELIRLLIAHDEKSRARAELLLLSANLPELAAPQVEAGRLFLDAGDPRGALDRFSAALNAQPRDPDALAGAGEAAFALGDYARAHRYLMEAADDAGRVDELRALSGLVLANDPLEPRLPVEERIRRLLIDLQHTDQRVAACLAALPAGSPSRAALEAIAHDAAAFEPSLTPRAIHASPETIDTGVELVDRMERQTQTGCAAATPRDRALMLIGRAHGLEER